MHIYLIITQHFRRQGGSVQEKGLKIIVHLYFPKYILHYKKEGYHL